MTRALVPLHAPDLSAFAKSLARQLSEAATPPGHQPC